MSSIDTISFAPGPSISRPQHGCNTSGHLHSLPATRSAMAGSDMRIAAPRYSDFLLQYPLLIFAEGQPTHPQL
eukprot:287306-Rhodomonas_salina.1